MHQYCTQAARHRHHFRDAAENKTPGDCQPAVWTVLFEHSKYTGGRSGHRKELNMGWGRTFLLGDIGNRLDIEDTEHDIELLKREMNSGAYKDKTQDEKISALIAENAELKLYLASVVRLLTTKGAISRGELKTMVEAIDAEDGRTDGRCDGDIV